MVLKKVYNVSEIYNDYIKIILYGFLNIDYIMYE